MIRLACAIACALVLAACSTVPAIPTNYAGDDAGYAVVGIGTTTGSYQSYQLLFRHRDAQSKEEAGRGVFGYFVRTLFFGQPTDFETGAEKGAVVAARLAPGDYEIYAASEFFNGGTIQITYGTGAPFSIPFTVRKGQVAYVGHYQATRISGRNLFGLPVNAGAYYAVDDQHESDVAIAVEKHAMPAALRVVDFTPDPAAVRSLFIVTPAERDRRKAE
jgi:hypothetical protein